MPHQLARPSLIGIKSPRAKNDRVSLLRRSADLKVPEPPKKRADHRIRRPSSARDAVSAVKMSEGLTAEIDAWAEAHGMARSEAICRLIELGLSSRPTDVSLASAPGSPVELEDLAMKQIGQLLDPSLPAAERERRIRRLIDGPPEFSAERIDLPKPRK